LLSKFGPIQHFIVHSLDRWDRISDELYDEMMEENWSSQAAVMREFDNADQMAQVSLFELQHHSVDSQTPSRNVSIL
jgi:hypothetical protein